MTVTVVNKVVKEEVVIPAVIEKMYHIELTQEQANELTSILYSGVSTDVLSKVGLDYLLFALRRGGAEHVRQYQSTLHTNFSL